MAMIKLFQRADPKETGDCEVCMRRRAIRDFKESLFPFRPVHNDLKECADCLSNRMMKKINETLAGKL